MRAIHVQDHHVIFFFFFLSLFVHFAVTMHSTSIYLYAGEDQPEFTQLKGMRFHIMSNVHRAHIVRLLFKKLHNTVKHMKLPTVV